MIVAYLLGALPFAYLVTRWRTGLDIRWVGEGNVGARNVWHVVGPGWGVLVGLLDASKGWAAGQAALLWGTSMWAVRLAGIAVVLGHGFPIFLHGRGGKGIAAATGFLLRLYPLPVLGGWAIFAVARPLLTDWNLAAGLGMGFIPLLSFLYGVPLGDVAYIISLFLLLAVKKIVDLPHDRRVRAERGWEHLEGKPAERRFWPRNQ